MRGYVKFLVQKQAEDIEGLFRCGHPMTRENMKIEVPLGFPEQARKRCRRCASDRQQAYQKRLRARKREEAKVDEPEMEYCRNGHPRNEENTVYESLGGGKFRRRCKLCRRDRLRNRRNGERPDAIVLNGVTLVDKSILDLTTLSQPAKLLNKRFEEALSRVRTPCRDNTKDFADYPDDKIPSPERAAALCKGCPLLDLCKAKAHATKPAWGVLGGEVWAFGQVFTAGTYNGEENNDSD